MSNVSGLMFVVSRTVIMGTLFLSYVIRLLNKISRATRGISKPFTDVVVTLCAITNDWIRSYQRQFKLTQSLEPMKLDVTSFFVVVLSWHFISALILLVGMFSLYSAVLTPLTTASSFIKAMREARRNFHRKRAQRIERELVGILLSEDEEDQDDEDNDEHIKKLKIKTNHHHIKY
ncbi:hypothetical protein AKO1_015011 [Acrasis kona]|uniref:Uncharacterized protein n=1 Tax=Acrasis kona TaxID=1008807 RepID=A0AAW2Z1G7_9EUKA